MAGGGVAIYDTTLRDGMQQEGLSVSVDEKVRIALKLDELGLHFIEGGFPASNPKETAFFARMERETLRHAVLVAFGTTRRKGVAAAADPGLRVLADASHAGGHHRRQDLGSAPARRAAREPRREPAHDRRVGRLSRRPGQARDLRLRALLRRLGRRPALRPADAARGRRGGRRAALPVRHQRRHPAADRRDAWSPRSAASWACRSACTATTTPTARWPTRWWPWPPAPCRCRAP